MFIPIYNWKTTSMIYIPQSHTHSNDYNTSTSKEEQTYCEDNSVCNFALNTLLLCIWICILIMVWALVYWFIKMIIEEW